LDGQHTFAQVEASFPGKTALVSPFVQDFKTNPNNWLRASLRENSTHDWSPQTPMHIVHCQGDDQTSYAAAQQTYDAMRDNAAADITFVIPDAQESDDTKWDHRECFFPSLKHAALWFVEMRDCYFGCLVSLVL
jgi:hypothetical protein